MSQPRDSMHANEARVAAAAGVVMEQLGLPAGPAFEWIMNGSSLTGIPVLELADLVVLEATRTEC
jgi:hypothetical protein